MLGEEFYAGAFLGESGKEKSKSLGIHIVMKTLIALSSQERSSLRAFCGLFKAPAVSRKIGLS